MHQDCLDRIAHRRILHLRVIAHGHSPCEIGVLVDIGVAQTFGMPQHGHTRVFLDVAHKRIAATWDEQVDILIKCQQGVDILASLDHLYGLETGNVNAGHSITNKLPEHTVRCLRFRAAFHDYRIARLPAQEAICGTASGRDSKSLQ